MSAPFGQCPLCPKNDRPQRLYGGLCSFHFKNPPKPKTTKAKKEAVKKALSTTKPHKHG